MEKAGTGVKRVTDTCKDNGNQVRFNFSDSFWVTIYSNDSVTDNVTDNVTDRLSKILQLIRSNNQITTAAMAESIGVSKRTILRDIEKLKNKHKLQRKGDEKSGFWEVPEP